MAFAVAMYMQGAFQGQDGASCLSSDVPHALGWPPQDIVQRKRT